MRLWVLSIAVLFAIAVIPTAKATDIKQPLDVDFKLEPLSENLTQKTVVQTFQDSRGVLWFLTQEGLNNYNGYTLENFRYSASDNSSISSNEVTRITEDSKGVIWISTLGGGLNKYNPINNGFTAVYTTEDRSKSPLSNYISTVFSDFQGTLWLGYKNAFSSYSPDTGEFVHYVSGTNGVPILGIVNRFSQTTEGTIWAATQSGLFEINPSTKKFVLHSHEPLNPNTISSNDLISVSVDKSNNVWSVSRDLGISIFNTTSHTTTHLKHDSSDGTTISSNQAYDAFQDSEGRMWIGTYSGLNLYSEETGEFIRFTKENTNLPSNRINSIFQSREGKYWVGTYYGLAGGMPNLFPKINSANSHLSSNSVNAFEESSDGSLWVGTDDGLNRLRPDDNTFEWINESTYPKISRPDVMSLLADSEFLWIGTFNGGLNKLNLTSNEVKVYSHDRLDMNSVGANGITSLLRTEGGKILIGTFGGGLSIYRPETDNFINLKNIPGNNASLSNNNVIALHQDSLGLIWVGTEKGLNRFDPTNNTFESFFSDSANENSISNDMVWAFYEDKEQQLWLGTRGGSLNRWSPEDRLASKNNFHHYAENISLPSSNIYGIKGDNQGNLWLSHNRGITRLNPSTMESHQYGIRDGLQDTEFNMGASFQSKSGTIYFGGNNGFNMIPPEGVKEKNIAPIVAISDIRIMNEKQTFPVPYYALDNVELDYEDRMLSVEFFAADYSNTELIQYAYKLDGINPDWVISPDSRIASFTTLPPGKYKLKMAASSPDGVWNWDALNLPITVNPPPWQSPIAYAIYTFLALSLAVSIYGRQRRQAVLAQERQRDLEAKVRERTADLLEAQRAAEDANKSKSDFLATMSHEIRTPMHGMIGMTELLLHTNLNSQQRQFASAAHNSGEALLGLINEILDFSKVEASKIELEHIEFNLVELIDEICYLQGEPADRKGLSLNGIFEGLITDKLYGDPTKIRQVIMNLVSNSIKFTHQGNVNVRVSFENNKIDTERPTLRITVEDQGIGMDSATQDRIFEAFTQADASTTREYGGTGLGLAISRHYIDLMGGKIEVSSELGAGTIITVSVPMQAENSTYDIGIAKSLSKAVIETSNQSTYEMISSHLSLLGSSSDRYRDIETIIQEADMIVIDYNTKQFESKAKTLASFKGRKLGIIATPLTGSVIPKCCSDWISVTKPVTLLSLKAALESYANNLSGNKVNTTKPITSETRSILVAEDVETNQKIAREMISMLGYQVDIAENGKEALTKFGAKNYDLIFMDCQMPIMDGYDATMKIRAIEEEGHEKRTPIVALTAGFNKDDRDRCNLVGMDYYLTKPFSVSDISRVLKRFVGDSQLDYDEKPATNQDPEILAQSAEDPTDVNNEIFNISAIENIKEVEKQTGRALLPSIFQGFVEQMNDKLCEINTHIESGDAQSIYRTAHAIKSMSANIGAEKVRSISAQIEAAGRVNNLENLDEFIEHLDSGYNEFISTFESEFMVK